MAAPKEEAAAPKKKGKLPIIIAIVAVVAVGGFFATKKDPKKDIPVETGPKLAHGTEEIGEFLINLKDGSYLSTKIAVQCDEKGTVSSAGDGHGGGGGVLPFAKDIVITVLSDKTVEDLSSLAGKNRVKRELAYHLNHASHTFIHKEGEAEEPEKKKKKKSHEPKEGEVPEELAPDYEPEYPEFDSDEGPVLKVFFVTFTTQK